MKEKAKGFDAVEMMREIRDRISCEISGMSFEEQRSYFKKHAERARRNLEPAQKTEAV